jgi:peptide/nickel transport system substrate-binding protein
MTRRRVRALWAIIAALSLLAAACGNDGDEPGGGQSTDRSSEDEGPPVPGGTLTMVYASDIDNLDPHKSSSFNAHNRIGLVYNRLLAFEIGPDADYAEQKLTGDLAERWEVADDGLTYTFHLRDGVTWQDVPPLNGRPLVADDVIATFERIEREGFQQYMLENVERIEAPDDRTVVIHMSAPFAPLLNFMANHYMWIIPREAERGLIDLRSTAIGTGPFIMTARTPNVETVYEKNPGYWEEGLPYLDGIRLLVVPDQGARLAAFRTGEVDMLLTSLSPEERDALLRTNPDTVINRRIGTGFNQLYIDMTEAPFTDIRVRRAMSMAIDRAGMAEAIFGGAQCAPPVPAALGDWTLSVEECEELQPYDPEGARELLDEAGLPNGFSTKMMITNGYGEQTVRQAQWVAEDLAEVGINAEIEIVEYGTYFGQRLPNVEYSLAFGPQTPFLEPDEWLRAVMRTGASRNWYRMSFPELDEMLDQQTTILDPEERSEYIKELQRYILEEVVVPIPTVTPFNELAVGPQVKGYDPHASYGFYTMKQVWLDE